MVFKNHEIILNYKCYCSKRKLITALTAGCWVFDTAVKLDPPYRPNRSE